MNNKRNIRLGIIISIVGLGCLLLILGFRKLNAEISSSQVDLYALIPNDTQAVIATQGNEGWSISTDNSLLTLLAQNHDIPGNLSFLISYQPTMGSTEPVMFLPNNHYGKTYVNQLIINSASPNYKPYTWDYNGEEIVIYPLKDNNFMAIYNQPSFIVVSLQLHLIQHVIDYRYMTKQAIETSTQEPWNRKRKNGNATLWTNMRSSDLCQWMEFNMQTRSSGVPLTGIASEKHLAPFGHALCQQKEIEELALTDTTRTLNLIGQCSACDLQSLFNAFYHKPFVPEKESDNGQKNNAAFFDWMKDNISEIDWIAVSTENENIEPVLRCTLQHTLSDTDIAELKKSCYSLLYYKWIKHRRYYFYTLRDVDLIKHLLPDSARIPQNILLFNDEIWIGHNREDLALAAEKADWANTGKEVLCSFNLQQEDKLPFQVLPAVMNQLYPQLEKEGYWMKISRQGNSLTLLFEDQSSTTSPSYAK